MRPISTSIPSSRSRSSSSSPASWVRFCAFVSLTPPARWGRASSTSACSTPIRPSTIRKGPGTTPCPPPPQAITWSIAFPRIAARFGVSDRVDLGAWGGLDPHSNYGVVGIDTKIALLRQGPTRPVSVSIRPSFTSLLGPSEVWVGNASIDLSVSRAFGPVSPYVGVATSGSLAVETSDDVDLDSTAADHALAYAGLSYRWRALVL